MKKYNSLVLILFSAALIVGACGSKAGQSTQTAEQEEKVTITYRLWGTDEREAYTKKQIEAFEEAYPNITVDLKFSDWATMKSEIDVIMKDSVGADLMQINSDWLTKYSPDGEGFYDLNELSDYIQLDAFSDASLSQGVSGGTLNALPIALNTSVPVYNKTMYDYYGLSVPETVEDLYEAAELMKGDNVYQLGLEDKQLILFLFGCYENAMNASAVDGEGNLSVSDEGYAYLAKTYKSFLDDYIVCPRSQFSNTRIEGNRVAGVICWLNSIESYKKIITDAGNEPQIGRFFWTNPNERLGNYYKPSSLLAIRAQSKHPKEAALLMNFLMNDQTAVVLQGTEKGVPDSRYAQQYLMEEGSLNNDTYYSTLRLNFYLEYLHTVPAILEDEDFISAFLTTLDSYANQSTSLEETINLLKEIK